MKNLLKNNWLHLLLIGVLIGSCCKEEKPSIYGSWETVEGVKGEAWDYRVDEGGQFCRSLEPIFPNTTFCYDYERDGDTLIVQAPQNIQHWVWDFECPTIAVVTIIEPGEQNFVIVVRKKK